MKCFVIRGKGSDEIVYNAIGLDSAEVVSRFLLQAGLLHEGWDYASNYYEIVLCDVIPVKD